MGEDAVVQGDVREEDVPGGGGGGGGGARARDDVVHAAGVHEGFAGGAREVEEQSQEGDRAEPGREPLTELPCTKPSNFAMPFWKVRPLPRRRFVPIMSVGCGATLAVVSEMSLMPTCPLLYASDWVFV